MLNKTYRGLLALLLVSASFSALAADPLLRVVRTPQAIFAPGQTNTCTIYSNGQIVIKNSVSLINTALSGKDFGATRFFNAKLDNLAVLKSAIAEAAKGTITEGIPLMGAEGYSYFAYQKQKNGTSAEIFLWDKNAESRADGHLNDSVFAQPLRRFIDSLCGDLSVR